ncbi:hypothetical protein OG288_36925 [Streptomyces tauricus]|uniref:Uncharacterized protein n=1 Tax=Streptomyces tauricus TaxID=68274 RepID=A0ABZ1JP67_9ACTN|nr:hypothetical protein [Streptomyces tauricus]
MDHQTLALLGLDKDSLGAVFGVVGTLLGATVAFFGIRYQVERQHKEAQLDYATKECGRALLTLLRQFRTEPVSDGAWTEIVADQLDALKLTSPLFRDKALRERLAKTVSILEEWHYTVFDQPNRDEYDAASPIILAVLKHAIDCIGTHRRGEKIPEPNAAFVQAQNNISTYWDWASES